MNPTILHDDTDHIIGVCKKCKTVLIVDKLYQVKETGNIEIQFRCPNCDSTYFSKLIADPTAYFSGINMRFWNWKPVTVKFLNRLLQILSMY